MKNINNEYQTNMKNKGNMKTGRAQAICVSQATGITKNINNGYQTNIKN